jgi:predicted negative regulator of RcsB-dependent stress response
MFRALAWFSELHNRWGDVRTWVRQLARGADSFPPHTRAELRWLELVTANDAGDNAAAQAAARRLSSLLGKFDDPYLEAVSRLGIAWTLPISGDYDGALSGVLSALESFRSQDEPWWTLVAGLSAAGLEIPTGRYEDARGHLRDTRELADRSDYSWPAARSRTELAIVAMVDGHPDEARALLDEALELSLAARSTRIVSLNLSGFAQLALVTGDAERAALLAGAADGLRRRLGMRSWPILSRRDDDLASEIREALGADRFEEAFTAGSQLNQQDAVAALEGTPSAGTAA